MDQPREHYRGTFLPVELIRLYESRTINAEEVLLLSKLDALQDPKRGGCWASNEYLAGWWGKSGRWVSETISKFEELGLVRTSQVEHGDRIIKVLSGGWKKSSRGVEEKFYVDRKKSSTKVATQRESRLAAPAADPLLDADEDSKPPEFSPEVKAYHTFSRRQGYHILSRSGKEVRYARGAHAGGWTLPVLKRWEQLFQELSERHGDAHVSKVLNFYLKHHDNEFAPEARTLGAFADKFDRIEKFMRRQLKVKERDGSSDDGEPEWTPAD